MPSKATTKTKRLQEAPASLPQAAPAPVSEAFPTGVDAINPATGENIGYVPYTSVEDMPQIFEEARRAQKIWAEMSFEQRRLHLFRVRDYLIENANSIARVVSQSNGKTYFDALNTEVIPSIMSADWYAKKARRHLRNRSILSASLLFANKRSYVIRSPLGVVAVISPWNYPFSIPFGEIAMGLMAGNAVLYKPAKETPLVAVELEKAFNAGGFPPGLCRMLMGEGPEISTALFQNGINKIFFTGSVRVGKILMRQAADTLTPLALELGGNDAMVVLEDANLERAANGLLWAGFQNSGQSCGGVERVYVHESVAEEFIALVKSKATSLRQGIERGQFDVDVGSMTTTRQWELVKRHVEEAVQRGAKIEAQTVIMEHEPQNFHPVTVLTNVDHQMQVMREETFGPVVGIMTFKTDEEAIALANDSDLGLTGSIWTMDNERGRKIAEKFEAGVITLNDHLYTHGLPELPWIGWKNSGIGATHSYLGLEEMTKPKLVNYDIAPHLNTNLWWFPMGRFKYDALINTMRILFGKTLMEKLRAVMDLLPVIRQDPLFKEKILYVFKRLHRKGRTRFLKL